jgi:fructose-1,6-bisphosphatase/inositol monophosphatase family enzyme
MKSSSIVPSDHKESLLLLASEAAREAGRLLREDFSRNPGVRSNAGKDVKTSADVTSEALIRRRLEATGIQILGEESVEGQVINRILETANSLKRP